MNLQWIKYVLIGSWCLWGTIGIAANQKSIDDEYSTLRSEMLELIEAKLEDNVNLLLAKYTAGTNSKYITGASISFKAAILLTGWKCEVPPPRDEDSSGDLSSDDGDVDSARPVRNKIPKCEIEEAVQIPLSNFSTIFNSAIPHITSKHFAYYLKRPLRMATHNGMVLVHGQIGTTRSEAGETTPQDPWDTFDHVGVDKTYKINRTRGMVKFTARIINHFSAITVIRNKQEEIKKIEIKSDIDRDINGELVYSRLGPGLDQTDITSSVDIQKGKSVTPLKEVITGDYLVSLKGLFCGCDITLSQDKVIDTRSVIGASDEHRFELSGIQKYTTVKGRLVDQQTNEPLKNTEVKLKAGCSDADQCMHDVKPVKTDDEGKFEFKNVPKGVYKLVLVKNGKELSDIKNCSLQAKELESGDHQVSTPHFYDIDVQFKSTHGSAMIKSSHVMFKWVALRGVEDGVIPQNFSGVFENGNPIDDNGNLLEVPFRFVPSPLKEIYWGVNMCDENSHPLFISLRKNPSATRDLRCGFLTSEDSLNDTFFEYLNHAAPARKPGHHLELQVDTHCYNSEFDMQNTISTMPRFIPGASVPDAHSFYFSQFTPDMLENIKQGKTFTKVLRNDLGSTLTMQFIYKGIEFKPNDCSNTTIDPVNPPRPHICDEFEEDCD